MQSVSGYTEYKEKVAICFNSYRLPFIGLNWSRKNKKSECIFKEVELV